MKLNQLHAIKQWKIRHYIEYFKYGYSYLLIRLPKEGKDDPILLSWCRLPLPDPVVAGSLRFICKYEMYNILHNLNDWDVMSFIDYKLMLLFGLYYLSNSWRPCAFLKALRPLHSEVLQRQTLARIILTTWFVQLSSFKAGAWLHDLVTTKEIRYSIQV